MTEYDKLYQKIVDFMRDVNPCKIKNGICYRGKKGGRNFCCKDCKHLTENGCSAKKPIACKLWLCQEAIDNMTKKQRKKYYEIENEYWHFKDTNHWYFDFRLSKEEFKKENNIKEL